MTRILARILLLPLLITATTTVAAEPEDKSIHMRLIGADRTARPLPHLNAPVKSKFLKPDKKDSVAPEALLPATAWYNDVYPGIDLVCFANNFNAEYVFIASPGSDPSLITFAFGDMCRMKYGHGGEIIVETPDAQLQQNNPVVYAIGKDIVRPTKGTYKINRKKRITLNVEEAFRDMRTRLNNTSFNIVPSGGQPGGPMHDFYISKFETSNEQILRFLNDAEKEKNAPRGANMFFDQNGDVWINPKMNPEQHEMFSIKNSQLEYDHTKPEGERYHHKRPNNTKDPFADHPATGVSWLGALKYCNWLTIEAGRGIAERSYTEGTNVLDWAPTSATNWSKGKFTNAERQLWLSSRGFRLPMVNDDVPMLTTNLYNEFYKAAAWHRTTNNIYGFGRSTFEILDANSLSNKNQQVIGSTPVGYYNGNTFIDKKITRENENIYGIYDLSGNIAELANGFARKDSAAGRIIVGGSLGQPLRPINICTPCKPSATDSSSGFRAATTYLPAETLYIHILYSFYSTEKKDINQPLEDFDQKLPDIEQREPEQQPKGADGEYDINTPVITYKDSVAPISDIPNIPPIIDPKPIPAPPIIPNPGPFVLTVLSIDPNSGVPITVAPADITTTNTGNTSVTFTYTNGTAVTASTPATIGANLFTRWIRAGYPDNTNTTIGVLMNQNVTITAEYTLPPLSISLLFTVSPIWLADPIGTTQLISTPVGGTGVYNAYEYEFVLAHHVTYTNWQPSAFVTQTNDFDWNYSIKYHVRVQDSSLAWSAWSNEAALLVNIPGPDPDPITQFGL
ncbi:MAG: SUMF1/EgtB/PvdO family nonheme iron enzyme [Kiritimatiellae bacterium]|nr:SUMF1/EgtB/PvdO family nonheme iron enzyme [Kiritimatiellia bacterium]